MKIQKTDEFDASVRGIRDARARTRIQARILRLAEGNPGDVAPIGNGCSELRIDYGPGYRVYYQQRGDVIVILLLAGSKKTQTQDIKSALKLASEI